MDPNTLIVESPKHVLKRKICGNKACESIRRLADGLTQGTYGTSLYLKGRLEHFN